MRVVVPGDMFQIKQSMPVWKGFPNIEAVGSELELDYCWHNVIYLVVDIEVLLGKVWTRCISSKHIVTVDIINTPHFLRHDYDDYFVLLT
jgi:hypothetical protein